jgi:hypothetical protein
MASYKNAIDYRFTFFCFRDSLEKHNATITASHDFFLTGKIKGCTYRMFIEYDECFLCIKDELTKGSQWRSLRTVEELKNWIKEH